MEKEMKIIPPKGYEIDKENSTFECIKFKPIEVKRFIDDENHKVDGFFINNYSFILRDCGYNVEINYNLFATEKLAKAALAIARLSQIRKYDKRFKQTIANPYFSIFIKLVDNKLQLDVECIAREHSSEIEKIIHFNNAKEAHLFLEENKELLLDYFGIND